MSVFARRFRGLLLIFTLNAGFCIYSVIFSLHQSGVFSCFFFGFLYSLKLDSNVLVYRDKIIFNCCRNMRVSVSNVHLHETLYYNMRERVNFKIVLKTAEF